jgi:hypothetical protein
MWQSLRNFKDNPSQAIPNGGCEVFLLIPSLGTSTPFMSMLMRQRKRRG